MYILEYLNTLVGDHLLDYEQALVKLESDYGISNRPHDGGLIVLNYSQITSPKYNSIVREARSLVVEFKDGQFSVVSRAFDRFFNYGEVDPDGCTNHDLSKGFGVFEKLDGSLVTLFNHNGKWMFRTKSMINPTLSINGFERTWDNLISHAIDIEQIQDQLDSNYSYIFEVTGRENRVVVRYEEEGGHLLSIRNNNSGEYVSQEHTAMIAEGMGLKQPRKYLLDCMDSAIASVSELPNLEEGYIVYSIKDNAPIFKIKNPAYVAAHHLRGEGALTNKRIIDLILMNESDEYLSIFSEDTKYFEPVQEAYRLLFSEIDRVHSEVKSITDQKEFALKVKSLPFSGVLFSMKKGYTTAEAFDKMTDSTKHRLIESMINYNIG